VLDPYEVSETVDEDARGPELYSPVHDYILEGKGTYRGPFLGILEMSVRLSEQDFVHPGKIKLEYGDDPES